MARAKTTTNIAYTLILTAAVFLAALPSTTGQSPAAAPIPFGPEAAPGPDMMAAPDCFTVLLNASDCLTFVSTDSNLTRPDPGCCPELANLVDTQPICLCQLLGNSTGLGLTIDTNKALALPAVCNVTTPPVTTCALIGIPVSSPYPSDAPSAVIGIPVSSPSPSNAPSVGGDGSIGASPSPGNPDNASPASFTSSPHLLIGLVVALFAYFL